MGLPVGFLDFILGRVRLDAKGIVELGFCYHDCGCGGCVIRIEMGSLLSVVGRTR